MGYERLRARLGFSLRPITKAMRDSVYPTLMQRPSHEPRMRMKRIIHPLKASFVLTPISIYTLCIQMTETTRFASRLTSTLKATMQFRRAIDTKLA